MIRFAPLLPLTALLTLAACNKAPTAPVEAGAAPAVATSPATGKGGIHELVLLERKDPADHDYRIHKLVYEMCKAGADVAKLPVKPFPPMPPHFGEERTTYIVDGKSSTIIKESDSRFDDANSDPQKGCEFRIDTRKERAITITHAGTTTSIEHNGDEPGKVLETNEYPDMSAYIKVRDTADYTDARTVNGVPLRCLPKNFWTMNTNKYLDLREMCVYATDGVLLDEAHEKPIILLSHVLANVLNPKLAHTAITEPLSLRVRASSEPDPFKAETWTK